MSRPRRLARRLAPLAVAAALSGSVSEARAAEITVLVSGGSPAEDWRRGYGGIFTITLFDLAHGEIEAARQAGEAADTNLLTLSAKAYVGPTIGRLVPYAGLGAGVYTAGLPGDDDRGTLGSMFLGAKLKMPLGLLVRAEVQFLTLPTLAPVRLERRFFVGAGLGF